MQQAAKTAFGQKPIVYTDKAILEYLAALSTARPATLRSAKLRLSMFPGFVKREYGVTVDVLLAEIKAGRADQYSVLAKYASHIKKEGKSDDRIIKLTKHARQLLEFNDVEISQRKFKLKVKLPRKIRRAKTAAEKQFIVELMQACNDPALELALLWHAATGRRPQEVFSIRHRDLDFKRRTYLVRGEFTKMGVEQERPMTGELATRTEGFMQWKHRPRQICAKENGRNVYFDVNPTVRPNDLLFAAYRRDETHKVPTPEGVYKEYAERLRVLLDRLGKSERTGDRGGAPRKFTLYRLRDFAKTTISDLGHSDFGEWYIGHSGSTYYNQPESKRKEIFGRIEASLTFLDVARFEQHGADVDAKLQAKEHQIESMATEIENLKESVALLVAAERERADLEKHRKQLAAIETE